VRPPRASFEYLNLVKTHRDFRNLWYGQIVSELGDWLNNIAIYALILQISPAGTTLAGVMIAKLLPFVLISPISGVVVDRISRRKVMIVSDLLRVSVVLSFLIVKGPEDLWLVYTLTILETSLAAFFEPARSAIIPSLIPRAQVVAANALSGTTWSIMLAFGSALGGWVVSLVGVQTAFIIDAITFLCSAAFISRIPDREPAGSEGKSRGGSGGFRDLAEGARYLISEPIILVLALLKSGLAVAGGIMTLVPMYAQLLLTTPAAVSMGIGILYGSRGVGAAFGPPVIKALFGDSPKVLQSAIAGGFFCGGVCYLFLAQAQTIPSAALFLGLAMFFGSCIWVFSTALIHLEAEDRFLGRIFSTEFALLTLVMSLSNGMAGAAVDHLGLTPHQVVFRMGLIFFVPGFLWVGFLAFAHNKLRKKRDTRAECPIDPSGFNPVLPMREKQD